MTYRKPSKINLSEQEMAEYNIDLREQSKFNNHTGVTRHDCPVCIAAGRGKPELATPKFIPRCEIRNPKSFLEKWAQEPIGTKGIDYLFVPLIWVIEILIIQVLIK